MDFQLCSFDGCQEVAMNSCECEVPSVLMCWSHIKDHLNTDYLKKHNLTPLFAKLSDQELGMLLRAKRKVLEKRSNGLQFCSNEYARKLSELQVKFKNSVESIVQGSEFILKRIEASLASTLIPRFERDTLLESLCKGISTPEDERENYIERIICSAINWEEMEIQPKIIDELRVQDYSRYSYSFKRNSKTLIEVDNETLKKREIKIESLDQNLGYRAGICYLDDGDIFYCGGYTMNEKDCMQCCYKINPKTRHVEILPNLPEIRRNIVPIKIDNDIFVFGGNCSSAASFRYNIKELKWSNIQKLPVASNSNYCVHYHDTILIAGIDTHGIYAYSISQDHYKKIFEFNHGYSVLLMDNDYNIYFLCNNEIHKSNVRNYNWTKVGTYNSSFSFPENSPQLYKDSFYFKMHPKKYKRFNFKTLVLEDLNITS